MEPKVERIRRRVYELMASGRWRGRISQREVAEEVGTTAMYVANITDEVSRELRSAIGNDKEALRAIVSAGLEAIREEARTRKRTFLRRDGTQVEVLDPDLPSALRAYELHIKMWGLDAPTEVRHVGSTDWDALSEDEKRIKIELAEQQIAALKSGLK